MPFVFVATSLEGGVLAVFLRIVAIFLVFAAGFVLRRSNRVDDPFIRQLSVVLMTVFYPCLIVNTLVLKLTLPELARLWVLPVGAALVMVLGWVVSLGLRAACPRWPDAQRRTGQFLCLMNNYSFLPLMLATSLWGKRGEALVVFSTLGPEIVLWTLGVQTIAGHRLRWNTLRNLLSMPMLAMAVAFGILALESLLPGTVLPARTSALGAVGRQLGDMLLYTCGLAGQATLPVSAIIAGMRMGSMRPHHLVSARMAVITALRLLAIPAAAILVLFVLPLENEVRSLLVVIAVMPVALTSVPMSEVYHADGDFAAAAVLTTHIACLVTIPLWLAIAGIGAG